MNMARAYEDYLQSLASGWNRAMALDHACQCWDVKESALLAYIAQFE